MTEEEIVVIDEVNKIQEIDPFFVALMQMLNKCCVINMSERPEACDILDEYAGFRVVEIAKTNSKRYAAAVGGY